MSLQPFCYRVDVQESQDNIASYIKDDVKNKNCYKENQNESNRNFLTVLTARAYEQDNVQHYTPCRLYLRCSYCDTVYSLFGEETPCEYN